jgi:hypothetical protein
MDLAKLYGVLQRKTGDRPLAALICLAVDQVLEEYYQHQRPVLDETIITPSKVLESTQAGTPGTIVNMHFKCKFTSSRWKEAIKMSNVPVPIQHHGCGSQIPERESGKPRSLVTARHQIRS